MPIIVDEIIISVEVSNAESGGSSNNNSNHSTTDKQALVAECVEKVLEVLKQREER